MKEIEKAEIKRLSDMLDALNHKDATVIQAGNAELIDKHEEEKEKLAAEIARLKEVRVKKLLFFHTPFLFLTFFKII